MTQESGKPIRVLPDWIEAFCDYTAGLPSPKIFRLWSAISAVAGALERRVWIRSSGGILYPNLYVLLTAPPAVGKSQAINPVKEFWKQTRTLKVAPDDVSKASLLDSLESAAQRKVLSPAEMIEYHSLAVAASEFGILVPAHDLAFLNTLNHIYDNPDDFKERKRTTKKETTIQEPQLNILAGTQPAYLAELLPDAAWGMGFTSRLIMVYSGQKVKASLFGTREHNPQLQHNLTHDLKSLCALYGELRWEPEAQDIIVTWFESGQLPVPNHTKLEHYNGRRIMHVLKLCAISACSRGNHMVISAADARRALEWLLEVERYMPDIFRAMVGRSDIDVLEELHMSVYQMHAATGKAVHRSRIYQFLQTRVPAERIPRIIESAIASGMLRPSEPEGITPTTFVPGAKPGRIVE